MWPPAAELVATQIAALSDVPKLVHVHIQTHTYDCIWILATQVPFLRVSAPEVVSGMSGESEAKLRSIFQEAAAVAPLHRVHRCVSQGPGLG